MGRDTPHQALLAALRLADPASGSHSLLPGFPFSLAPSLSFLGSRSLLPPLSLASFFIHLRDQSALAPIGISLTFFLSLKALLLLSLVHLPFIAPSLRLRPARLLYSP